ncbi:MAG: inositol monophosphatase [Propionibacteriaceae bacterium]|jgi:fructose-1,6-bisphosphatase/inositol monophosphatase family enzyme|nr:inositol monophosphatase [Propionibacteriaceae bacterium]
MRAEQVAEIILDVTERVIMPRFGTLASGDIEEKKPGDLVTVADREAEAEIAEALAVYTPDALVVGEEGTFTDQRIMDALPGVDHAWVLDPIDGTRNFAKGNPDFAVMLAEVVKSETVRSWIYQPVHHKLYAAELGAGVTCNGERLTRKVSTREVPLGALFIPARGEDELGIDIRRSWGSAGIDYPNLLAGEVDFLAYRSMFPWDHLPAALMINELGGKIASEEGIPYRPGVFGRRVISAMTDFVWKRVRDAIALR